MSGIRNIRNILRERMSKGEKNFEVFFHQDLDGVASALCIKKYLEDYGMKMVDCHIIQYGGLEFAIKNKKPDSMAVLVDYANFKSMFTIATDHHDAQRGNVSNSGTSHAKPSRSNAETLSGEVSKSVIFNSVDTLTIQTVDSANFLVNNVKPSDVQKSIFCIDFSQSPERNRFKLGLATNRLILALKTKRIVVTSINGVKHTNRNLLECLVLDSTPSMYSLYNNLNRYLKNAVSLEWNGTIKSYNSTKDMPTKEIIDFNLDVYKKSRIDSKFLKLDNDSGILRQDGIGDVFNTGSYERYIPFELNPDTDFLVTLFPMGLIQASCNPFKEKKLKNVNLGKISELLLNKYNKILSNFNIPISELKKESESEVNKKLKIYGNTYKAVNFTFEDLKNLYPNSIIHLPNRENGDMKTRVTLDLNSDEKIIFKIRYIVDKPYSSWNNSEKEFMSFLRIPLLDIIKINSGGHPSITNLQGFSYLSCRVDLLEYYFKTKDHQEVMNLIFDDFINILKMCIDKSKKGLDIDYNTDIKLLGIINNE